VLFVNNNPFELLAPGGDLESIKAAILAGADAVYCGLERFNARNRAANLSLDDLKQVLKLAHHHQCKIFLTLNIILLESEIQAMVKLLNQLVNSQIDGVIIQDLGLAYLLKHYFPSLDVHASTQLNTHNQGQILFLKQLGISRTNLSRELNIDEIKTLAQFGHQHNMLMEVFVHGSYCIGFSGLCYISSVRNGASGNRGRCSQPCRDTYQTTDVGVSHPLNMKDNSAFLDIRALADAGVYSLKIEGRIKKPHYVYTVVDNWRKQIDHFCATGEILTDTTELYKVFNRDFSNGYLQGNISRSMFIDNPRNHSATHFAKLAGCNSDLDIRHIKEQIYDANTAIINKVNQQINQLEIENTDIITRQKHTPQIRIAEVRVPKINPTHQESRSLTRLAVLISASGDLELTNTPNVDFYYQLPNCLDRELDNMVTLFNQHNQGRQNQKECSTSELTPWFPAIMLDADFTAAEQFLERVKPHQIVSNNTGIGYLAYQKGIDWIAGPQLNIINNYTLLCLKEEFNCRGAFISNEIKQGQLQPISKPKDFRLFYSIYHPINLLTSRQCLFQQSVGCRKPRVTKSCLPNCEKSTSIINLNGHSYVIDKQRGEHNSIYSDHHYLNLDVLNDFPDKFSDLFIDLRTIPTQTHLSWGKRQLIEGFTKQLNRSHLTSNVHDLHQAIYPTSNAQYKKGL
jgi:putative protease